MCPQPPRLSPEYSHKAGLQTVITGMPLQIRPVTRGGHAGPVTMGRITRGPLSWTRPRGGMTTSQAFVWCRIKRRVSLPVLSPSDQRIKRRPRAKGGVFAFAPTPALDIYYLLRVDCRGIYNLFLFRSVSFSTAKPKLLHPQLRNWFILLPDHTFQIVYTFIPRPKVPMSILYLGNMLVVFLRTFGR
jgi:hypothetical protein